MSDRIGIFVPVRVDYTGRPSRLSTRNSGYQLSSMARTSTAGIRQARTGVGSRSEGAQVRRADARRNRARVLEAAIAAFGAEGLSVPIHEIARRAGVGTGTVSRHFPTKEALFVAIIHDRTENIVRQANALAAAEQPGEAFFDFLAVMVNEFAAHLGLADALAGAGFDVETVTGASSAKHDVIGALRRLLARAQKAGAVRPDVDAADVKALIVASCTRGRRPAADDARRRMVEVISQGLRPPRRP